MMNQRNFKAIALASIALLWFAGGAIAQQTGNDRQLAGSVVKEKEVQVYGGEVTHQVVLLKTDAGRYMAVDLGPVENVDITTGDDIQVVGRLVRISDRPVILAREVTSDGETLTIERMEGTGEVRTPRYHTFQGEVINTKTVDLKGTETKHRVVRIRTTNGNTALVDLGPAQRVGEVSAGDEIQVTGRFVRVGDRLVLMAREYGISGQTAQVSRSESYPWTEGGLEVQQADGIQYVSGGISDTEQQAIRTLEDDFSLKLVFAVREGNYLSNVEVTIQNQAGEEVLSTTTEGPILLADLAPGTYTVMATSGGDTNTRTVRVPESGTRQVNFYWVGPRPA